MLRFSAEVPLNELKFELTLVPGAFATLLRKQSILRYNQLQYGQRDESVSASSDGALLDVNTLSSD